jgi:hypothetical protein
MSAEDPEKCCKVLLTWREKFTRFRQWEQVTATATPPKKRFLDSTDQQTLRTSAERLRPFSVEYENFTVNINPIGILENEADFETTEKKYSAYSTHSPKVIEDGKCKRFLSKRMRSLGLTETDGLACNCVPNADFVPEGGQKVGSSTNPMNLLNSPNCVPLVIELNPESVLNDLNQPMIQTSTTLKAPRYTSTNCTVTYNVLKGDGDQRISELVTVNIPPVTFYGPKIPVKTERGATQEFFCDTAYKKEIMCCL